VSLLPLHEPLALAKQLSSLDYFSGGRVIAGVGVGYVRGESDAIGVDFATRGRRADDGIDAMRDVDAAPAGARRAVLPLRRRPVPPPTGQVDGGADPWRRHVAGRTYRAVRRCEGWYGISLDVEAAQTAPEELR
jgi:alkanesulfonate monooxygenase SsuD/methylene tetrahydromethanopterin reductase-like flavin-dependent oxidoreductase (luciferase family)